MKLTTLVYIENDGAFLMLHRNVKPNDANANKYIGIGGKLNRGESPKECILREIKEECGLSVRNLTCKGIITFILPKWEDELCFLYTATSNTRNVSRCDEGELSWVNKEDILNLNLWEGDPYFLKPVLQCSDFIECKLMYDNNDNLVNVEMV